MAIEIIQEPFDFVYTRNPVVLVVRSDLPYDPRIQILCEVYFEEDNYNSNNFVKLVTLDGYPDPTTGIVVYNLQENLNKAMLQYDLPAFTADPTAHFPCEHNIRRFKVIVYEWDGFAMMDKPYDSFPYNCIRGGIIYEDYPMAEWFETRLPSTKQFLTWMPQYRLVPKDVRHWLYFLHIGRFNGNLRMRRRLKHTGNINAGPVTTFLNYPIQVPASPMWAIAAGFDQLQLQPMVPAGKAPLSYGLTLYDGNTPISEERWFTIDHKNYRWRRIFHYNNSLGGFDMMYFTGAEGMEPEISSDSAEQPINLTQQALSGKWGYNSQDGHLVTFNAEENLKRKIRTGHKTRKEIELLRDFWMAPFKLETYRDNYLPVIPDGKSLKLLEETDSTWNYEFMLRQAYKNTSHGFQL